MEKFNAASDASQQLQLHIHGTSRSRYGLWPDILFLYLWAKFYLYVHKDSLQFGICHVQVWNSVTYRFVNTFGR
jgi:hypothetical protein